MNTAEKRGSQINSSSTTKAISDARPQDRNPLRIQKAFVMLSAVSYLSREATQSRTMSGYIGAALLSLEFNVCESGRDREYVLYVRVTVVEMVIS